MAKLNTKTKKRLAPTKRWMGNKTIVITRTVAASILFFACCLFFFQNTDMFIADFKKWSPFPYVFFAGLIWVCIYMANLISKIEDKNLYLADRYEWVYKIVFTVTILAIIVRCFFFLKPFFAIPVEIVVLCVVSGVLTLITPKIIDNNNNDF